MENTPQQTSEGNAVVRVLAAVLERLVKANAHLSISGQIQVTKFHALKAPGISILQYLERIYKYASCSTECFILALIYIDRLIQKHNFVLTELNVHRVVITSVLLAAKFFDDAYYNNAYYAKVGGVLVSEMNGLEVEFLFRINFSLHVKPDEFAKYQAELVSHAVGPNLERAIVCTYEPQSVESPSEVSQPPSPQPMSSQSTSPSLSPGNNCSNEGDGYHYDGEPVLPTPYWTNSHNTGQALTKPPHSQQPFFPSQTTVPSTSTQNQELNETFCPQSQITPSPSQTYPQCVTHHDGTSLSNLNVSTTDSTVGDSFHHISPNERRAPFLPRYHSYPYSASVQSRFQAKGVHLGNNVIYPTINSATQNNPTTTVSIVNGTSTEPLCQHTAEALFKNCGYERHKIFVQ